MGADTLAKLQDQFRCARCILLIGIHVLQVLQAYFAADSFTVLCEIIIGLSS